MTTLLLWGGENGSSGGDGNRRNSDNNEAMQLGASGKQSKKAKIHGGTQQKKQPQRGLGVAQLERLRLLEQRRKLQEENAMAGVGDSHRMAALQPYVGGGGGVSASHLYAYGRQQGLGGHGAYSFPVMDLRHHRHGRALSAQNRMLGLGLVPSSNPGRGVRDSYEPQLPYFNGGGKSSSNNFEGLFAGIEDEDYRFRGFVSNIYPYGRPSHHREISQRFSKPLPYGQFVEMAEILKQPQPPPPPLPQPPSAPFLQSVALSKVGIDHPKELSSFQIFHENPNRCDPAGIKHPLYAMQQRPKHRENLAAALDLRLSTGENNAGSENGNQLRFHNLLHCSSASLEKSDTGPVIYEGSLKSMFYHSKRKGTEVAGSKHGADFLALRLSTSGTKSTEDSAICEIHRNISSAAPQNQAEIAVEESEERPITFMLFPPSESDVGELAEEGCDGNASTDATVTESPAPLDLSLKLG